MRKFFSNLCSPLRCAAVGLLVLGGAHIGDAHASPQDAAVNDVGGSYTVCHDVAVPPSYALVGIQTNAGCNHGTSYTVAPASPGMRICNLSQTVGGAPYQMPFPDGYIVQTIQEVQPQQSQCGGATAIYIIQPVAEGTTACSGTQIPTGWSYTASSPSPGSCGTFERIELHQSVAGMRICSQSPYPNGFVVGAVESMAACGLQERYVLQPTSDGVKACGPTHVPAGYVITNTNQSGQCGSYQTLTLRAAYDGVVVCPASPIPDRYVIQSAVPYNGCENFTTANQLKYIP